MFFSKKKKPVEAPKPPPAAAPSASSSTQSSVPPAASLTKSKLAQAAAPSGGVVDHSAKQTAIEARKGSTTHGAVGAANGKATAASSAGTASSLLQMLPLKTVPVHDRAAAFQQHLIAAQQTFNFNDPSAAVEEKEAKRVLLLGLVEHINSAKDVFSDAVFPDVIAMLSANLFRDLPSRGAEGDQDGDDDEPILEPAWPHLQIVYEFLLRFVVSADVDAKVAKKYISQPFISQLLELFNSEDPREREYLKTILHRVYGKYMGLRAFIRRAINYIFFRIMYDTERHNGIGELLEILGSIINGFALPLKAEHKRFLVRALIPLHKIRGLASFHNQLSYCVSQFVEKDPRLLEPIMLGVLRFWPHSSSPKQVLFLNELEDLLELAQPAEFTKIAVPLFERINACTDSPHFQVAERALFLWNNEYIVSLIAQNRNIVLPVLIQSLTKNSTAHWNTTVVTLTANVLKVFMDMDKTAFKDAKDAAALKSKEREELKQKRQRQWELITIEGNAADVL